MPLADQAHARRSERFRVDAGGFLVRAVIPRRGSPYEHRCALDSLQRVCHRFDERGERGEGGGHTVESLAADTAVPVTQAATAVAFLRERGIVTTSQRRSHAATADVYLDAMIEYHALRELGA